MFAVNGNNLSGKIGNKYVVWFGNSNNWVLFEEPAWYVYKLVSRNNTIDDITRRCIKRYGLSKKESEVFVNDINQNINQLSSESTNHTLFSAVKEIPGKIPELLISHTYRLNNQSIRIHFQSPALAYYIHPLLSHFASGGNPDVSCEFSIYTSNKRLVLQKNQDYIGACIFEDIPPLKRQLFIELSGIIYKKPSRDWISFVHASGITDGRNAILLAAGTGSGKSTMAALLMKKGLKVISDDFLPVCGTSRKVYSFPLPVSVKKVALPILKPFFPGLENNVYNYKGLSTAYINLLPLESHGIKDFKAFPVKSIIFPGYRPNSKLSILPLSSDEALQLFIKNAIINPGIENAARFIKWFLKIPCYRMEYPDAIEAAAEIQSLFIKYLEPE